MWYGAQQTTMKVDIKLCCERMEQECIYEVWFRYDLSTGNIIIIDEVELPSGRKLKNSAVLMECPYCKRFLMK